MEDAADLSGVAQAKSIRSATQTKAEAPPPPQQQQPDVAAEMEEEEYWDRRRPMSPDPPELRDGLRRLKEAERAMGVDERAAAAVFARPGQKRAVSEIPEGWSAEWDDSLEMVKRYRCNYWENPNFADLLRDHGPLFARAAAAMNDMERWD
ncbi:hypothetical protein [Oryza sativa Japonica Group]|uniref:Uncharacterized protein n=2 Tax=Oryza TaxID=4527 RepID=Q9LGP6_ORYSJ|nr:hypothetical protein OsJ_00674 [Oryza sativa Japonica Group]BAB03372.1 hypothetical protein [Oryza sativa Japonica Group]